MIIDTVKFPGMSAAPKKIAPNEPDEMKDYWLVTYDETELKVENIIIASLNDTTWRDMIIKNRLKEK